jgi:hypothetical protein
VPKPDRFIPADPIARFRCHEWLIFQAPGRTSWRLLDSLPPAKTSLADRACGADWFRNALIARGITPCVPSKTNRTAPMSRNRSGCFPRLPRHNVPAEENVPAGEAGKMGCKCSEKLVPDAVRIERVSP